MDTIQIIELEDHDDIDSIRDRILSAQSERVLLVIPWDSPSLRKPVDLQVAQRLADANGIDLAIVSTESDIRIAAHDVGLPAFRSVDEAQRKQHWHKPHAEEDELKPWTPSRRKRREAERAAVERNQADAQARRRHPAWLAVKIGIFVVAVLVLLFAALAIIPQANIRLVPQSTRIVANVNIIADATAEAADPMTGHIPATAVNATVRESITIPTTGKKSIPDTRAQGPVIFVNQLNTPVRISQGTVVRTSATGQATRFILTQDVEVPAGIGAQAQGVVEAVEPGAAGNVPANFINEIEGVAALAARVSNPADLTGGADKEVKAVDAADREAAKEQITPLLRDAALKQLQTQVGPKELLIAESMSGNILDMTYDHEVTEQADNLTLVMRVQYAADKVSTEDANSLAFGALKSQTPPGYQLIPEGLVFQRGEAVLVPETNNQYQFPMQAIGFAAANLDVNKAVSEIAGKRGEVAQELLSKSLPLKKDPEIKIYPGWFPFVPWLSFRIQTQVDPQG